MKIQYNKTKYIILLYKMYHYKCKTKCIIGYLLIFFFFCSSSVLWKQTAVLCQETEWSHEGSYNAVLFLLMWLFWGPNFFYFLQTNLRSTSAHESAILLQEHRIQSWQKLSYNSVTSAAVVKYRACTTSVSADLCSSAQSKGAKEKIVTRTVVSRCEVDLKKICSEYKTNFGQSLQKTIMVSELYNLFQAYYWFAIRLVLSRLLRFCRNTPRETTRRLC